MLEPIPLIIQILLAVVVGAVGFIVKGLADDIREFTKSLQIVAEKISELRIEMLKDFALKNDLTPIRERMEKLASDVSLLMAQAELRRKGDG